MPKKTKTGSTESTKKSHSGNPSSVKTSDDKPTMEELLQSTGYKDPSLRSRTLRSSSNQDSTAGLKIPSDKQAKKNPTMEELLKSTGYKIPTLRRGQEVVGRVISLTHSEMLLDIGAKSEGIIFGKELSLVSDIVSKIKVGDEIDAVVVFPENDAGQVVLSLKKLSSDKRWAELDEKKETEEAFDVVAVEANKGGLICEWNGIRGFLPASQLSTVPSKIEELIGKTLSVRIIELDRTTNRLIFSQKITDAADLTRIQNLLSKIKIGDKYDGTATAVLPFGVFVEIEVEKEGKLEGLVHISEISWEKVEDPAKLFKVGQKVEVMVISIEQALGRLNLSIKQLAEDPFAEISEKYTHDLPVAGTIARITPGGAFVELEDGLEGHVPVSKIPQEAWEIGQSVECLVESVDVKARKINLVPVVKEKPILYR